MKKNYLLFFTLTFLIFSHLVKGQTLTFTSDAGSLWNDGIATDGEGGSIGISGLTLEIYNVDDALNNIVEMEWRSNVDLAISPDNFTGLTTFTVPYGSTLGWKGQIIKEASGLEFQINAFDWFDWGNYNEQAMIVTGFKNGFEVATTNFLGNDSGNRVPVTLNSDFDSVDEVRILTTSGTTYPAINNIEIASAVLSTEANLFTDVKVIAKNKKFISNTIGAIIEVYGLLGQKIENENLLSGIYIVKVTLKNGKSIALKRYL